MPSNRSKYSQKMREQAARLLIEKIKKPEYRFQTYMTMPLIVTRESTKIGPVFSYK